MVRKVLTAANSLPDYPELGSIVPELGIATIRECFVYSYRLIYKVDNAQIMSVAIIHGKRLLQDVSERF